jgi:pimeloyl-ACP methyl ester carboxylesterase
MFPLAQALGGQFDKLIPDLPGHGSKSSDTAAMTIESITNWLNEFIRLNALEKPFVFGYSLGGYVALYHALKYPDVIGRIFTFGTKYAWTPEEAAKQVKMLNADAIEAKVPSFAQVLKERHGNENWRKVLSTTAGIMQDLGDHPLVTTENVSEITIPVCIAVGSDDYMVTLEESKQIASSLPFGVYKAVEGLPHAIEKIEGEKMKDLILEFIYPVK